MDEYLVDFKAMPASIRAGYRYSVAIGTKLLKRPNVAKAITVRCLAIQVRLQVNADDVRQGFARIATDPRAPAGGGPTVSERIAAWRELGKLLGLYVEKLHHTGTLSLEDLLRAADRKGQESARTVQ